MGVRLQWLAIAGCVAGVGTLETHGQSFASRTLTSGSGAIVSTAILPLDLSNGRLIVEFGFATQESPRPQLFADSWTISLENPGVGRLYLSTADATGVLWAPPVFGAGAVADTDISRSLIEFQPSSGQFTSRVGYHFEYEVPPAWAGSQVRLRADLFDNRDGLASEGWVQSIAVIPEPSSWMVAFAGLSLLAPVFLRRTRSS